MNTKSGGSPIRTIILLVVVFIALAAGIHVYNVKFPHVYSASAEISLAPNQDEIASLVTGGSGSDDEHFGQEIAAMKAPDLLIPIIQDNHYDAIWAQRSGAGAQLSLVNALDYFDKVLVIEMEPGSGLIKITGQSVDPKEAADLANDVANAYVDQRQAQAANAHDAQVAALQKRVYDEQALVSQKQAAAQQNPQDATAQQQLRSEQTMLEALQTNLSMLKGGVSSPIPVVKVATYAGVPQKSFLSSF